MFSRGEQIKAVMELKNELNLHDGTPLGETLIHAAEQIRALQKQERKFAEELEDLVRNFDVIEIKFNMNLINDCLYRESAANNRRINQKLKQIADTIQLRLFGYRW